MTHPSKRKGNRYEREIVEEAEAKGLEAERAFASDGRSLGEDTPTPPDSIFTDNDSDK